MSNSVILIRHCYWTSNLHGLQKKIHKTHCDIMSCLQCNIHLNKGNRVSAHVEKHDGSMGLVITCNPCNTSNPRPKIGQFPTVDNIGRYFTVSNNIIFNLETKSPQWKHHIDIYGQKETSKLWKSEFNTQSNYILLLLWLVLAKIFHH